MTLEQGRRKVLLLLDEYSNGGALTVDEDINHKMNDFFDIAQKDMAQWQPIVRRKTVVLDGSGSQTLGDSVERVLRVQRNGQRCDAWEVVDGALVYEPGDTSAVELDYIAVPQTIGPETPGGYVFEVGEAAANCLPFFVAAQQLVPDLVVDYGAFYNLYLTLRSAVPRGTRTARGGGVRQRLFAGPGRRRRTG